MNHPHHNYLGYGQAGDWCTTNKKYIGYNSRFNAEEPIPAHRQKVGIRAIKKPMVKESQYHNDYPNWGKIPKSVNLNPGLAKTIADNMPFFGKSSNNKYGGFSGDPTMGGQLEQFMKPKDQ